MWQIWLIASGVFLIAEVFTVSFLVFWLSIGALLAMLVSFFTTNVVVQMTVFVISSGLLIFATRPLVNKLAKKDVVSTNVYSIIGKRAIVVEDIDNNTGRGQIKVDGEIWSAKTQEQHSIPKGSEVEIESINGVKAYVKPINIISTKNN